MKNYFDFLKYLNKNKGLGSEYALKVKGGKVYIDEFNNFVFISEDSTERISEGCEVYRRWGQLAHDLP